ncbi:hypothetical protein SAMN04490179_1236 [Pseudomonas antarctica]|uniref:Uncharacterized protein n=1 Tax=Pseudomonas antarctica TaxID=219572 RepID=A0A1G9WLW1_9PSED|nr:hypothetical protein PSAN_18740 [Pseudomonas antarctica]SDM85025.1 hypothetical protein SAMN04490179_1236 [Pseudomonas antarctica]
MVLEYIGMCAGAIMLLSFPLIFHVMFKKLDAAEHYMQYSTYIVGNRHTFRNAPFDGRPQRVLAMATVILIPRILQWRRLALVEDVEKIPRPLKYWMVIPSLILLTSVTTMMISSYFLYYY